MYKEQFSGKNSSLRGFPGSHNSPVMAPAGQAVRHRVQLPQGQARGEPSYTGKGKSVKIVTSRTRWPPCPVQKQRTFPHTAKPSQYGGFFVGIAAPVLPAIGVNTLRSSYGDIPPAMLLDKAAG